MSSGQDDEATAKTIADKHFAPYELPLDQLDTSAKIGMSTYRLVEGRDLDAGNLREAVAREQKNPATALFAAVALLRAGEKERAVRLLGEAKGWTTSNPKAPNAARRAGLFHEAFVEERPLTTEVAKQLAADIDTFAEWEQVAFRALYGELMTRLGNREEGYKLLRKAAEAAPNYVENEINVYDLFPRTFAAIWLREHLERKELTLPPEAEVIEEPDA